MNQRLISFNNEVLIINVEPDVWDMVYLAKRLCEILNLKGPHHIISSIPKEIVFRKSISEREFSLLETKKKDAYQLRTKCCDASVLKPLSELINSPLYSGIQSVFVSQLSDRERAEYFFII